MPEYRQEKGNSLNTLVQFHPADAEDACRRSVAIYKGLLAEDPGKPEYRKMLAVVDNSLGGLLAANGHASEAEAVLAEASDQLEALIARAPTEVALKNYLGRTLADRANLRLARKDAAGARPFLERAIALQREALKPNDKDPDVRLALHDHLDELAVVALDLGNHDEAARLAAELIPFAADPTEGSLAAARLLARCATAAQADTKVPDDRRKALANDYAARAVGLLRGAITPGRAAVVRLEADTALAPLHARDDFKQLVASLNDQASRQGN